MLTVPSQQQLPTTAQAGDLATAATWLGCPPPGTTNDVLNINHNTTVTGNYTSGSITIASGVDLNVSGTLNIGPANGGNKSVTATGTLTNTGTINLNGSLAVAGGFTMSSGLLNVDPNDGTSGGSAAGNSISFTTSNLSINGGAINLYDPPWTDGAHSIRYNVSSTDATIGTGCTITVGSTAGGSHANTSNTTGFLLNGQNSTGTLEFGTVIIDGGRYSSSRHASTASSAVDNVKIRDLTVNSGAELLARGSMLAIIGTTLVNNGVITVTPTNPLRGLVFCGDVQNTGITPSSGAQSITGTGLFKKSELDADPAVADNVVNALHFLSTSTLTLETPLSVVNLSLGTGGTIITTSTNVLTIGYGPSSITGGTVQTGSAPLLVTPTLPLTAAWAGGWVVGPVRRWFTGTSPASILPVGDGDDPQIASITYTVAPTSGRLEASYTAAAPDGGSTISPELTEGALSITKVSPTGSWDIQPTPTDGVSGGTYSAWFYANDFKKEDGTSTPNPVNELVLLKRNSGAVLATDWTLDGTHVTTVTAGANIYRLNRTGMSGFSQFAMGGTSSALPLELLSFTGKTNASSNMLLWETLTEKNVQWHIVERSVDGIKWLEVGKKAGEMDSQSPVKYELEDRTPPAKAYYRLRSVDFDGAENLSGTILLTRKGEHFGITAAFPSPAKDRMTIQFASLKEEQVTIRVTDISGRLVLVQEFAADNGINEAVLQLADLQAGVYLVRISNATSTPEPVRIVKE